MRVMVVGQSEQRKRRTPQRAQRVPSLREYGKCVSRDEGTRMEVNRDIRYASTH
jgi:hypothetical protein